MNCIVLAAGYATRLYPLTLNFPKPLLRVGDKTIVDRLLDDLDRFRKIDRYVVVSNSRYFDSFERWRDDKENGETKLSAPIEIVDDGSESNAARLGAVNDLLFALETLDLKGDAFVVAGDNLLDFSLKTFLDYFEKKGANAVMRVFEPSVDDLRKRGVLEIGDDDRVLAMAEKPVEPKSHWRCPPFYLYRELTAAKVRAALADGCGFDAPGSFLAWLCRKEPVFAAEAPGKFFDVGDLASYRRVQEEYRGIRE